MKLVTSSRGRTLDFDIENMPVTYYAPDYPTAFVTAIAWAFTDKPKEIEVRVVTNPADEDFYASMLSDFLEAYDEAYMVSGHYIRKHDLPIINGAMIEAGFMQTLTAKMVSDTKEDLVKFSNIPKNQEYLEDIMGTAQRKIHMNQNDWRRANRFLPDGIERTRKRVMTDVRGNMQMRQELIERGLLKKPRIWRP